MPAFSTAFRRLRRFLAASEGGFAVWTAAALIPLGLVAGAATDLNRVETYRRALQQASDAAALSAGRAYLAGAEGDAARLDAARAAAAAAFAANLDPRTQQLLGLAWDVRPNPEANGELVFTASGRAPLVFGGLLGMNDFPINTTAATLVAAKLEVALVLDTTGSMNSNNKLGILKSATQKLIDELSAGAALNPQADPLKLALVPYSNTVRLPASLAGAAWFDGQARGDGYWGPAPRPDPLFDRFQRYPTGWAGCVESRPQPYDVQLTAARAGAPDSLYVPFWNPDDANPNAGCTISEVLPLTTDANRVKQAVQGMNAEGFTNIPMGLLWGWNTLAPGTVLGGGGQARADLIKAVVLVTDGDNDLGDAGYNLYSGIGRMDQERMGVGVAATRDQRRAALDERLARLCTAMKAQGIVIYAIRVEVASGNDEPLRNCATNPGAPYFYDVRDADQLPAVFAKVSQGLLELRLTR